MSDTSTSAIPSPQRPANKEVKSQRYPRHGFLRVLRSSLLFFWAVIGWYFANIAWTLVQLAHIGPRAFSNPEAVANALVIPWPIAQINTPGWVNLVIALVFIAVLSGCIWALLDIRHERKAGSAEASQGWKRLTPYLWLILIVLGVILAVSLRAVSLTGVPKNSSSSANTPPNPFPSPYLIATIIATIVGLVGAGFALVNLIRKTWLKRNNLDEQGARSSPTKVRQQSPNIPSRPSLSTRLMGSPRHFYNPESIYRWLIDNSQGGLNLLLDIVGEELSSQQAVSANLDSRASFLLVSSTLLMGIVVGLRVLTAFSQLDILLNIFVLVTGLLYLSLTYLAYRNYRLGLRFRSLVFLLSIIQHDWSAQEINLNLVKSIDEASTANQLVLNLKVTFISLAFWSLIIQASIGMILLFIWLIH